MQREFLPGQRWLSEAEPDLGLGIVLQTDGRHVLLEFRVSGQQRNYAARNAPLSRVRFVADDRIQDQSGRELTVIDVEEQDGLINYRCQDVEGIEHLIDESMLNDRLRLNRPQDKLMARRIDPDVWFTLRYQSWLKSAALWQSPAFGLRGPRIDLIPHQLYIAAEVAGRAAPRVLLADEVGLGKTIEAGLILHRLILTERAQRILIILPDALIHQWLVEMLRRFNLSFAVFDQVRFDEADSDSPFQTEQRVLCSLSFLTSSPGVAKAALDGEWDLLVVDEAHHLAWSEEETSLSYQLVEALAEQTASMLLLTATPEQLGRAGHFGRLRLLDPQRFHSYADFVAEEEDYAPVAALAAKLLDGAALDTQEQQFLQQLLGDEAQLSNEQVIASLIDRHGTGRVLFRNTRQAIKGFPKRRLHTYSLDLPDQYRKVTDQAQPEQKFRSWTTFDPRVAWLKTLLGELAPEKVLLICAHAKTAAALRDHLLEKAAIHAAMFHEGMEIVARDRAAAFFADPEGGAQVLICSEIGSEGRNFQFAHHLVLFDLPLDADLLEQRIGRLDRIGQRQTIELHVPYLRRSAGEVLTRWYSEGLNSFEATCPAAAAVREQLGGRLQDALADPAKTDDLVAAAAGLTATLNTALEAGRDRLLELHSHQPQRAARLVEELSQPDVSSRVDDFMTAFWDAFGVEHESGPGRSTILRPGAHMLSDHFPGLGQAMTITWDRQDALAHEDRHFMTWEHPMVRGSMDMLASGEIGAAAVTVCSHADYRAGTVMLECLFVSECVAPPGLEVQRYMPATCLRYLLNTKGDDLSGVLPHDALSGLCLSQNRKLADTVIKSLGDRLKLLLAHAEELAIVDSAQLAHAANERVELELVADQQRLRALARVNPNVREEEIEQIGVRRELLAMHIAATRVRLDAVRIVVMR